MKSPRLCLDCSAELPASFDVRRQRCDDCRTRHNRSYRARYMRAARAKVREVRVCAEPGCSIELHGMWQRCEPHALERKRAKAREAARRQYRLNHPGSLMSRATKPRAHVERECAAEDCEIIVTGKRLRCPPHAYAYRLAQTRVSMAQSYARKRAAKVSA